MEKPRRRAAGRPAGPPDIAPPPEQQPTPTPVPESDGPQHRRRQRPPRAAAPAATPELAPVEAAPVETATPRAARPPVREERRRGESAVERSLRALVSTRTTTLTPTVAMRAREVAAPTAADLAEAAEELVIVRRHYIPPAPLTSGKKDPGGPAKAPDQRGRTENRRGGRRPQRGAAD